MPVVQVLVKNHDVASPDIVRLDILWMQYIGADSSSKQGAPKRGIRPVVDN
ncbi:MAG: hypothetical protein H0U53_00580 [Actinobacteria bacterium]|nr:hypothetical protein [Actinomycetota bacterium]